MNQGSWTITVATIRGIPIRLHLTFIAFIAALVLPGATSLEGAALELLFLLGIFSCIALHELGHAFAASLFNIKTRDIVLYPFGGIASITKIPSAKAELVIALAGPLVNIVIASILFFFIDITHFFAGSSMAGRLFLANIFLAIFNLIPAIPMDGGRVLRALLELANIESATTIATRISQLISFGFATLSLFWGRVDLLLVAIVVFFGAVQEQVHAQARRAVQGRRVSDAMIDASHIQTLSHGVTLSDALLTALRSLQDFFPVVYNERVRGVVSKDELLRFAASHEENAYVQEIITAEFPIVAPDQELHTLLDPASASQDIPFFIVQDSNNKFLGMLYRDKIIEFLLIDELKRRMTNNNTLDESAPL